MGSDIWKARVEYIQVYKVVWVRVNSQPHTEIIAQIKGKTQDPNPMGSRLIFPGLNCYPSCCFAVKVSMAVTLSS